MRLSIPKINSLRDAYAFRQHVEASRKNRGLPMIPEFDEFPVYYYGNHNAIIGAGKVFIESDHFSELDFELEIAAIIGKRGKNISVQEADLYIAGFTIMNDFSSRAIQKKEMKLNLGPAKGKDFATALGPHLVTKDELAPFRVSSPVGDRYDLEMKAFHNGIQVSCGNAQDMTWTFAQIIARISYGTEIYPGDVIGSGTVGTGCFYETNLIREVPIWLKDGDIIELEITGLGKLRNEICIAR